MKQPRGSRWLWISTRPFPTQLPKSGSLVTEAGTLGGIYAEYMRSEGDAVIEAVDQAIRIGREGKHPPELGPFNFRVHKPAK